VVAAGVAVAIAAAAHAGDAEPAVPGPDETILRVARSSNGLVFEDTGVVVAVGAAAPDLTVLPNGELLLLFDRPGGTRVARSGDGGVSFSMPRRVRFHGGGRRLHPQQGDLVVVPDGYFRLFFLDKANGRSDRGGSGAIHSAVSRDGVTYRVDRRVRPRWPRGTVVHPVAGWIGNRLHVLAGVTEARAGDERVVQRMISMDGRRFAPLEPFSLTGVSFVGSMIPTEQGARAYVSRKDGMGAYESTDGRHWERRTEARLPSGWDPAVVQLGHSQYLMVYCAPRDDSTAAVTPLIGFDDVDAQEPEPTIDDAQNAADASVDADVEVVAEEDAPAEDATVESIGPDGAVAAGEETPVVLLEGFGADGGTLDGYDPALTGGFAPLPNFATKVNYMQWYKVYGLGHPDDNAYDAYRSLVPEASDKPGDKPEWPELNNMFTTEGYDAPPGPWDPADHPEWAASDDAVSDLIERYCSAARHANYAQAPDAVTNPDANPEDRDLLIGILLPSLSSHRKMTKAILARAWRLEDGKVSPDRMIDAFETTLRVADHMRQGTTLIEDLVGAAIANMTRNNARWALKQGVFSADELERALDTLQRFDVDGEDPAHALRGEHAFALDFTQHMFTPPTADGLPHFNRARAERTFSDWFGEETSRKLLEGAATMTPEDVYNTVDAFDAHYRELSDMMRIGYPQVRAADITALEQEHLHASPVTESLLPALSRYYQIMEATRASRRATQLVYATELFKARNGRYPDSLDELPDDRGAEMKIDPFSGDYFRYELTEQGPRIYSVSEDGIDNGGAHSRSWGMNRGEPESSGSDDYVFWPPQYP